MSNRPWEPKKPKEWTYWNLLDPTTVPGFFVYSIIAYICSVVFSRVAAPWVNKQMETDQEETKKKILARREQKEKEAQALLSKLN